MATKSRNQTVATTRKKTPPQPIAATTPKAASSNNGTAQSATDSLRRLYASLLRCRLAQEAAEKARLSRYQLAIGEEAAVVAPTAELDARDTIAASASNLAALIARGLPVSVLLGKKASDCVAPTTITGASLPADPFNLATGVALTHKLAKESRVVVAFCPDASPALETWHDALKFAGVHKLPIVYVIRNGVADQQSASDHAPHLEAFSFMARDYGYPGIIVDGQDVVAVWRVAQESIHRARSGSGPTLIDCRTDPGRDPLAHMEHYMRKRNAWDERWKKRVEAGIRGEIEKAQRA